MDMEREALTAAHTYWQSRLPRSWAERHINWRQIDAPSNAFGYAPPGWRTTSDVLLKQGFTEETILAAGLAHRSANGTLVDHFRERLIIPVRDHENELVGFVGRARPGEETPENPKYVNSPATALYDKCRVLMGLGEQALDIQRGAMPTIVEGPFDRYALSAGTPARLAPVAPCGTALTDEQVNTLLQITPVRRPIALCLDGDAAGQHATLRAWEVITRNENLRGRPILHIALPDGKDPADLCREDPPALRQAVTRPRPLAYAVLDARLSDAGRLDHVGKRVALMKHVIASDLPHVHSAVRTDYLLRVAKALGVDPCDVAEVAGATLAARGVQTATVARRDGGPKGEREACGRAPNPATRSLVCDSR